MNDRQLFQETFDAVKAPDGLLERVVEQTAPPRRHRSHRGMVGILVAAVLIVALSVTTIVIGQSRDKLETKEDFVTRCNLELDTLHDMGLFLPELALTVDDLVPEDPQISTDGRTNLQLHQGEDLYYSINVKLSPSTQKILCLIISVISEGEKPPVVDQDMTLKDYCDIWAEYHGYGRYEIPEGVDPDTPLLEAHNLEQWKGGIYDDYFHMKSNGLVFSFYRKGHSEPDLMYLSYENEHMICFGSDYFKG